MQEMEAGRSQLELEARAWTTEHDPLSKQQKVVHQQLTLVILAT
jgi:hypothetical protein